VTGTVRARGRNRTRDIFITSEVLYQLSYSGGRPILGRPALPQEPRVFPCSSLFNAIIGGPVIGQTASGGSGRPAEGGAARRTVGAFLDTNSTQIQPDGGTLVIRTQTVRHGRLPR
jgi:hypothetical protein